MNDWVFWTGLALILVGMWVCLAEGREDINPFTVLGIFLWTTSAAVTTALATPLPH